MKRITLAALAGGAMLFVGTALAQQNIDFAKVEIKTTDLGNRTCWKARAGISSLHAVMTG